MGALEGWFASSRRSRGMSAHSALVVMEEPHPAVAATLVLQEMGLTVDVGSDPGATLNWLQHATYDVIVIGGPTLGDLPFAAQIRGRAPDSRIVVFGRTSLDGPSVAELDLEVILPPHDVNALVERFLPSDEA